MATQTRIVGDEIAIGLSDTDGPRCPFTGLRVLLIVDKQSGNEWHIPLPDTAIASLHKQTSPVKIAANGDGPRRMDIPKR